MKELTALKKLVEQDAAKAAGSKKVFKMFDPLVDKMENAYDNIKAVSDTLQSQVLTDLLKQEGFPATESAAAKRTAEAAFKAVKEANEQLLDLFQALGMHFEQEL